MKRFALTLTAVVFSGAAIAQTTEIRRTETPSGSTTTVTKEDDGLATTRRSTTTTTGSVGCETKTVTKENDLGDRKTKSTTDC